MSADSVREHVVVFDPFVTNRGKESSVPQVYGLNMRRGLLWIDNQDSIEWIPSLLGSYESCGQLQLTWPGFWISCRVPCQQRFRFTQPPANCIGDGVEGAYLVFVEPNRETAGP
jgi:hypothetical protein